MITLEAYRRLQEKVRKLEQEADRNDGAIEVEIKRLQEKYQCMTIEEAKKRITKLKEKNTRLLEKVGAIKEELRKEWGDDSD